MKRLISSTQFLDKFLSLIYYFIIRKAMDDEDCTYSTPMDCDSPEELRGDGDCDIQPVRGAGGTGSRGDLICARRCEDIGEASFFFPEIIAWGRSALGGPSEGLLSPAQVARVCR